MNNAKDSSNHHEKSPQKSKVSFYNDVEQMLSSVKGGPARGGLKGMSFEPEVHNWTNIVKRIVSSPLH